MKFNVSSKNLYSTLSAVSKVISTKNAMTILNNFLFEVTENQLIITASDLENTLVAKINISECDGTGTFCADARRMVEMSKELPEVDITFMVKDDLQIQIDYPGGQFDFVGIPGNEYPATIEANDDPNKLTFEAPIDQIIDGIDNTIFAVGNDDLRPQMMGILLDIFPDKITFVSTDTRKLVKYTNSLSAPGIQGSFILPSKPANIIKNVFIKEEKISITVDSKSASFSSEKLNFTCRLIKGNFPDYNRVIPQNNPYTLTVDRTSMINAVRRVGVFVDQSHGLIKFRLNSDTIELKAQDNNFCTLGQEKIPCSFTGNEMIIGFSANFIIDIFNTLKTNNVLVKLSDPSRPGVFLPEEDSENSELLMLLMPMTVHEF